MKRTYRMLWTVAAAACVAAAAQVPACADYQDDCMLARTCPPPDGGQGGSGGTGGHDGGTSRSDGGIDSGGTGDSGTDSGIDSGGTGDSGTDSGIDSGPPPSCVPSLNHGNPIAPTCPGVFVSNANGGDAGPGLGTQAAPFTSITAALSAKVATIYVCSGATAYTEAVTLSANVTLYGGLDCGTWAYNAAKPTQLEAAADSIPVTLSSLAKGSSVFDFTITAAAASVPGGSSIAILDNGADLSLTNVTVNAGNGKAGANGVAPTPAQVQPVVYSDGGVPMNGSAGQAPAACTSTSYTPGGAGGQNTCNGGTVTTNGGTGGEGLPATAGENGFPGSPAAPDGGMLAPTPGGGGAGETGTASCGSGAQGADFKGMLGNPGIGANGFGSIDENGYHGPVATPGGFGTPGEGGGGGGGALACNYPSATPYAGPSGGGGGAGGCGGVPGNLGQTGGSSIGIVVFNANLTLTNVKITAVAGGAGGTGAAGQTGGVGGLPGGAVAAGACGGANGGTGGNGGYGPGGAGGNSVGIAISGGTVSLDASSSIATGSVGTGGQGSDATVGSTTNGSGGSACKTLTFTGSDGGAACGP
jgi:hypothetical protein